MITKISDSTVAKQYRELYSEAEAVLSGYIPVKTYTVGKTYAKRDNKGAFISYEEDNVINNAQSFADQLLALEQDEDFKDKNIYQYDEELREIVGDKFTPGVSSITTLEEYYYYLNILKTVKTSTDEYYWMRFIQLPLDEPHFVIDADKRSISIPSVFKSNGIGVQGDHMAEVVFFEINRFYDYMDLDQCKIYVQWEAPKTQNGIQVSEVCYKRAYVDTDSTDKLMFAWAISDALTQNAGTLKFSIRFFKEKEGSDSEEFQLEYSYSTLTATVTVQQSMSLNLAELTEDRIDNSCALIGDRIGQTQLNGGYHAAQPVWVINLVDNKATGGDDLDPETRSKVLYTLATVSDTGALSYNWYKVPYNAANEAAAARELVESVIGNYTFGSTEERDNFHKTYPNVPIYYIDNEEKIEWKAENKGKTVTLGDDGFKYFIENVSYIIVDSVGEYYVEASNKTTGSVRYQLSKSTYFFWPEKPEITSPEKDITGYIIGASEGNPEFEVKAEVDYGTLSYQWFVNDDPMNADGDFEKVEGETNSTFTPENLTPGYYKATVVNNRNGEETEPISTFSWRVTNAPEAVKYTVSGINEFQENLYENGPSTSNPTIVVNNENSVPSDNYIVDWYVYEGQNVAPLTSQSGSGENPFILDIYENREAIYKATKQNDLIATYYATIKNELNGKVSEAWTDEFSNWFKVIQSPPSAEKEETPEVLPEE